MRHPFGKKWVFVAIGCVQISEAFSLVSNAGEIDWVLLAGVPADVATALLGRRADRVRSFGGHTLGVGELKVIVAAAVEHPQGPGRLPDAEHC